MPGNGNQMLSYDTAVLFKILKCFHPSAFRDFKIFSSLQDMEKRFSMDIIVSGQELLLIMPTRLQKMLITEAKAHTVCSIATSLLCKNFAVSQVIEAGTKLSQRSHLPDTTSVMSPTSLWTPFP